MSKVNILIAGATGYIGVQLVKILNKHKYVKIKYLCGNSSIGKNISFYDKNLQTNNQHSQRTEGDRTYLQRYM